MPRKAQSYSCPFCTYTGEKQENAQKHMERHVRVISERAGYELVKKEDVVEIKVEQEVEVTETPPSDTNVLGPV